MLHQYNLISNLIFRAKVVFRDFYILTSLHKRNFFMWKKEA